MKSFTLRHVPVVIALAVAAIVCFLSRDYVCGLATLALLFAYGYYVNTVAYPRMIRDEEQEIREAMEERRLDSEYARELAESDARHALLMAKYDREEW